MWREIDDGIPPNADLKKHTEGLMSACLDFRFPDYIDHIITDVRATALVKPGSFEQVLLARSIPRAKPTCPTTVRFPWCRDRRPGRR